MKDLLKSLRLCVFMVAFVLLAGAIAAQAKEVQNHGVVFEKWTRDTFFDGYEPKPYTQKTADPAIQERPLLWGVPMLVAFDSPTRSFRKPTEP